MLQYYKYQSILDHTKAGCLISVGMLKGECYYAHLSVFIKARSKVTFTHVTVIEKLFCVLVLFEYFLISFIFLLLNIVGSNCTLL